MKLKAIGAITARVKQLIILDEGTSQWVGDGYAFYLLPESLGQLNEKTAAAIFDIPEEKAGMFAEAIIMPMAATPELSNWMTTIMNGASRARFYGQREIGTDEFDGDV